ncbi:hypothetical protein HK097_003393 [Rhizophlyctis rosea]|uniref:Bro-N domain-containing protein n=1 Tax=Rhizophlyctis rosea TaxID=64517 RepID=A0AAD5X8H8_9FUNG|nr:hypothetical protein HK097_003393 [Rhizophlyctis rosea]
MSSAPSSSEHIEAGDILRVEGSEVAICETFKDGPLTSPLTIHGTRDQPLFRLSEVEKLLGKSNLRGTVKHFDDDKKVVKNAYDTLGRTQEVILLTEEGIITLMHNVRGSPVAKTFRRLLQDAETARAAADQARLAAEKKGQEAEAALKKAREANETLKRRLKNKHQKRETIHIIRNPADAERKLYKNRPHQGPQQAEQSICDGHARRGGHDSLRPDLQRSALDPGLFRKVVDSIAHFVDGLTASLDNVTGARFDEVVKTAMHNLKNFDAEDGNESDSSSSTRSSVVVSGLATSKNPLPWWQNHVVLVQI